MSQWQAMIEKMPEPIRRDPKKSAILAGLLVVLAAVGVKQFVLNGPSKAGAASTETVVRNADTGQVAQQKSAVLSKNAEKVEKWIGGPVIPLEKNLFAIRYENFERRGGAAPDVAQIVDEELFWDRLAKSLASRADLKRQRQIRLDNFQLAASKLKVQSTIMGSSPRALIEGRMCRLGDTVIADPNGTGLAFKVIRIESRRLVVEREGIKVEVPMGSGKVRIIEED